MQFYINSICNFITNKIIFLCTPCFSGAVDLPMHNAVTIFNCIINVSNVLPYETENKITIATKYNY